MGWFGNTLSDEDKDAIIAGLKQENKGLHKEIKVRDDEERDIREEYQEDIRAINKRHERVLEEVEERCEAIVKKAKRECDDECDAIERAADKRVRQAEDASAAAIRETKGDKEKTEVAVARAVLAVETKHVKEVTDLKVDAAEANARASAAEELVESYQGDLETMTDLMREFAKENNGFAKLVVDKLPTVELTKMSVNVELPAPEVTVVNTGGNKGGENKNGQGK
jgi:hypothetical protein